MTNLISHERAMWLKNRAIIEVLLYKLKCSLQCFRTNKELDVIESQRITGRAVTTRIRSFQAVVVTGRLGRETQAHVRTSKMAKGALTELRVHTPDLNRACS